MPVTAQMLFMAFAGASVQRHGATIPVGSCCAVNQAWTLAATNAPLQLRSPGCRCRAVLVC